MNNTDPNSYLNAENRSVICYVRPWNEEQMRIFSRFVFPSSNILNISEHRKIDQLGLSKKYYEYLKKYNNNALDTDGILTHDSVTDMIARCRLLRSLDRKSAVKHLFSMAYAVSDILKDIKPSHVLSLTVDSFVMDLIRHFCNIYEIKFVGLVPTFVNGYYRVSERGEPTLNTKSDKGDINLIHTIKTELLKESYTPAFIGKAMSQQRMIVLKRWASSILRVPFFGLKRLVFNDYYNYHYWVSHMLSRKLATVFPAKEPGDILWETKLRASKKPKIYIPLQMFPECTVDYWCTDILAIDYYNVLFDFINAYSEEFTIVVKEHPGVIGGYRPKGFYNRLKYDERIIVIPTFMKSNNVLELCDAVLIWTGSVGFEAALRGKAVFALGNPYYASGERFYNVTNDTTSSQMITHINKCKKNEISEKEQDYLVGNLIMQLFKGSFLNDGTWSKNKDKDIDNTKIMAKSLRNHLG